MLATCEHNPWNCRPAPMILTATMLRNCSSGRVGIHRYAYGWSSLLNSSRRSCGTPTVSSAFTSSRARKTRCTAVPRSSVSLHSRIAQISHQSTVRKSPVLGEMSKRTVASHCPLPCFRSSSLSERSLEKPHVRHQHFHRFGSVVEEVFLQLE